MFYDYYRCDYGYYGDISKPFGQCSPCECNAYGSQSDQCDQMTGQCFCVDGVTGRDCSQCQPRHVLTQTKACKNCNNFCTQVLLTDLRKITKVFNESDVANLDPTPEITLANYERRTSEFDRFIGESLDLKQKLRYTAENADLLQPQGDLVQLEAINNLKRGKKFKRKGEEMIADSDDMKGDIDELKRDILGKSLI